MAPLHGQSGSYLVGQLVWFGGLVDATTVIAICGVIIAVASLGVSAYVAWATRKHNRLSVRPLLGLTVTFPVGATAGLCLTNSGLGPARIVSSQLTFDGQQFGEFNKANVDRFRDRLAARPHAATLGGQPFLDTDYRQFLLNVDPYDPSEHGEFREMIERKLRLEIKYESIYGEAFTVVYPRRGLVSSPPAGDVSG
jgi:hypothetical protein